MPESMDYGPLVIKKTPKRVNNRKGSKRDPRRRKK